MAKEKTREPPARGQEKLNERLPEPIEDCWHVGFRENVRNGQATLAATATAWRWAIWRAAALLVLALAVAAPAVGPTFVGNDVVDLTWAPVGEGVHFVYLKIPRDGGEIWRTTDSNVRFFRRTSVVSCPLIATLESKWTAGIFHRRLHA